MATKPSALTYDDLQALPEDNLRREIIDGELIVTAAPRTRHQAVVAKLTMRLGIFAEANGGAVFPAPTDVFFSDVNIVEPDVLFVRGDHLGAVEKALVRGAPDLVIEVSSPSTRRLELVRKKELYERFGIPEYWQVDIDVDQVQVYRLDRGYGMALILGRSETIDSSALPGFSITVDDLLGPPEDP